MALLDLQVPLGAAAGASINLASYYLVAIPLGYFFAFGCHVGGMVIDLSLPLMSWRINGLYYF